MFDPIVSLGIACLLAPVFAEYAGIREMAKKGFSLIAGAGVLYILSGGFSISHVFSTYSTQVATYGAMIFDFIAWIMLLIGGIMAAYKLAAER